MPAERQRTSSGMLGTVNSLSATAGTTVLTAFPAANPLKATVTVPGTRPSTTTVPDVYGDDGFRNGLLPAPGFGLLAIALSPSSGTAGRPRREGNRRVPLA